MPQKRNTKKTVKKNASTADPSIEVFAFFTEVGIISQLSGDILARSLPDGVHPSHFFIVNHLCRVGDGSSPLRISQAMQVTKTTMTHSLKLLEGRGFIKIKPNPEDARSKLVYMTEKGRRFREKAIASAVKSFDRVLDSEQRQRMRNLYDELVVLRQFLDNNRI